MSRTIRRNKNCNKTMEYYWIEWECVYHSGSTWPLCKIAKLDYPDKNSKEYKKAWWSFHNDKILVFAWHRHDWGQVRSKNKTDLVKWIKNDEHECFFWEDVNKADWTD
jgi:hypothetical protein